MSFGPLSMTIAAVDPFDVDADVVDGFDVLDQAVGDLLAAAEQLLEAELSDEAYERLDVDPRARVTEVTDAAGRRFTRATLRREPGTARFAIVLTVDPEEGAEP